MNTHNPILFTLREQKNEELKDMFKKISDGAVSLSLRVQSLAFTQEIVQKLCLSTGNNELLAESFRSIFRAYWKKKSFDEFLNIVLGWVSLNKLEYLPLTKKKILYSKHLQNLKAYYEKLTYIVEDPDKRLLKNLLTTINTKLGLLGKQYFYEKPQLCFRDSYLQVESQSLEEIFHFYAKSHIIIGKYTTFDHLQEQKRHWTCGVLIKFCTVFGLHERAFTHMNSVSRKDLMNIFQNLSYLKKTMNFQGFLSSFEAIAEVYFKEIKGDVDYMEVEQRFYKILLAEKLKLGNLQKVRSRLKKSVKCFAAPDYQSRIPNNDPSQGYRFLVDTEIKKKLKTMKIEKKTETIRKKIGGKGSCGDLNIVKKPRPLSSYSSQKYFKKNFDHIIIYSPGTKATEKDDLRVEIC